MLFSYLVSPFMLSTQSSIVAKCCNTAVWYDLAWRAEATEACSDEMQMVKLHVGRHTDAALVITPEEA